MAEYSVADYFPMLLTALSDWGYILAIFSGCSFLVSLILIPWLIVRIPEDYFIDPHRHQGKLKKLHPALYISIMLIKNVFGIVFLLLGVAMLILPGQGILTIMIGLFLLNFPGKYTLERWLIRQPAVYKSINWVRTKATRPELLLPHHDQ